MTRREKIAACVATMRQAQAVPTFRIGNQSISCLDLADDVGKDDTEKRRARMLTRLMRTIAMMAAIGMTKRADAQEIALDFVARYPDRAQELEATDVDELATFLYDYSKQYRKGLKRKEREEDE